MADKDLQSQMLALMEKGDFAGLAKLAKEQTKAQDEADKAKTLAIQEQLLAMTTEVQDDFKKLVGKWGEKVKELVGFDKAIIKAIYDPAEGELIRVTLTKSVARAKGTGGGGTPKTYDKGWQELLTAHGDKSFKVNGEDSGQTIQEAWNSSSDGNHRFKVRKQMIAYDSTG